MILSGFDDVLRHPDLSIDMGLTSIKLLLQHNRFDIAFESIQELSKKFQHSPDLGSVWTTHFEMLVEAGKIQEAKKLVANIISGRLLV